MSINNSYTVEIIESDGSTTRFRFNFFIFNKQELKIKIAEEDGSFTDLEYETDYSVENSLDYSTGGYVNLVEAVEQGKNIIFYRETDILQQINLVYLQTLNPKTLTSMFDKLTAIAQELNNEFYRSFKFDYEPLSAIDQTKVLNEYNIKHLDPNNTSKIVAVTLKYDEESGKWQLATTSSDPDSYQEQITENKNNITATNSRIDQLETTKQNKLNAGSNITIDQATNTISANDNPDVDIEAGDNIIVEEETSPQRKIVISLNPLISNQVEQNKQDILTKQDKLTAGENITIENNVISSQSGGSHNLFDPVFKDHLLTYEEKFGLELLGEYVYKTAVAGTRYGYPDFYSKVLAEYNDPNNTDKEAYISSNITKVGDIIDNEGVVSEFSSSKYFYTNKILNVENNPFEVIIKIKTGANVNSTQTIISGNTSTTYPPLLIRIESGKLRVWLSSNLSSHNIANGTVGTYTLTTETDYYIKIEYTTTQYIISVSTDNQNYTQDITVNSTTAINSTLPLYFAIYNTQYPFLGSFDLNETKININNQLYWQGTNTFTYKKNTNGHNFFDIADKDKADEIYNNTGIAWFYGVDTTNERIFLPRNDYCFVNGNVGEYFAGELPNGSFQPVNSVSINPSADGLFEVKSTQTVGDSNDGTTTAGKIGIADKYINSSRTQGGIKPTGVGVYVYMCVGNVAQEEAQGQYIDMTTTENDTTPLFTAKIFEFDAGQENPSWLRANGNYVSGLVYPTCYAKLVNLLNYNPLQLKVVDYDSLDPNTDYSEYWIVNQTNQTFRTPLKTSERILVSKKEPKNDDTSWYNLYSDGWLEQGDIINDGSAGSRVISLAQSFKNTNYSLFGGAVYSSGSTGTNHQENPCEYIAKTNSSFTKYIFSDWIGTNKGYWWKATGYTNIPVNNINLFFKVANAVENLEIINGAGVLSALNNKLDLTENMIPSSKYDNLTLGTSGTTYIAPANGYFSYIGQITGACGIVLENITAQLGWYTYFSATSQVKAFIPCKKGDTVKIEYYGSPNVNGLKFIYSTNN